MTSVAKTDDIVRLSGQHQEVIKRVANGSLDVQAAKEAYQQLIEGDFMSAADHSIHYTSNFLWLEEQHERIHRYNRQYWDHYFSGEELDYGRGLDPVMDNYSMDNYSLEVDDLLTIHVEFGSLEETIEMWRRVFVGELPDYRIVGGHSHPSEPFSLLDHNVQRYESGAHLVRINLVAHWEPEEEEGDYLKRVRKRAQETGELLAHTEVLSAFGIHTELFRRLGVAGLPESLVMSGTDLSGPDIVPDHYSAPVAWCINADTIDHIAEFCVMEDHESGQDYSAPVIIRES